MGFAVFTGSDFKGVAIRTKLSAHERLTKTPTATYTSALRVSGKEFYSTESLWSATWGVACSPAKVFITRTHSRTTTASKTSSYGSVGSQRVVELPTLSLSHEKSWRDTPKQFIGEQLMRVLEAV